MPNTIHGKPRLIKCITFMKMFLFKDQSNPTSSSHDLVSSRQWKCHQSVYIPNRPHFLRKLRSQLYQSHSHGITVYDAQLKQVKNISIGDMSTVYDVCDMPNGDLVVAAHDGLYHYKTSSEYEFHHSNIILFLFAFL